MLQGKMMSRSKRYDTILHLTWIVMNCNDSNDSNEETKNRKEM